MDGVGGTVSGHLLGGRVAHRQLRAGHRTGIEPVLLAAAVPARPGETVLEGGCGSGAALLCLAARVPDLHGFGAEIDPALANVARENFRANGFDQLEALTQDVAARLEGGRFDHAFANPPWHPEAGTPSDDRARERARRATPDIFAAWASHLARPLRHRGTLTFVVSVAALPACLEAFREAGCGGLSIFPLWPRAGAAAKLVLIQGARGSRAPARVLAGLTLHESNSAFTPEANAVLRDGAALDLR